MKATAIICEYNPLTNGHLAHLKEAREQTGADTVFCVMSGSFTQRGDAAIADKYQRAAIAVRLGCDMVVELPTVFAVSPADNFAYGAIKTISALPNVEYLSFGSECGDAELLEQMAELLLNEPAAVKEKISLFLNEGHSFPKARAKAVDAYIDTNEDLSALKGILDEPNNILGIAYIIAAKKLNLDLKFHTIKRIGGGYNDESVKNAFPSATAIRSAIKDGRLSEIKNFVPPFTYNLLEQYNTSGTSLGDLILFRMKEISGRELEGYYDINGGLHNRLKIAANASTTYEQYLENAKTKKYTMAKIKRVSLYAMLNITKELYDLAVNSDPYVFVLAMNKERKDILSALSETAQNLLVRYSDIDKVDKNLRPLIKLDFKAQGILGIINRSNDYIKSMQLI
jgi:predicted nucleotidyltransferase